MTDNMKNILNRLLFYAIKVVTLIVAVWLYCGYCRIGSWPSRTLSGLFKGNQLVAIIVANVCRVGVVAMYAISSDYAIDIIEKYVNTLDIIVLSVMEIVFMLFLAIAGWVIPAVLHFVFLVYEVRVCVAQRDAEPTTPTPPTPPTPPTTPPATPPATP